MIWLRRGFVLLLSAILLVSLVGGVVALDANRNLANPAKVEKQLADSKIYDNLVVSALAQAEKSSASNGSSGSVALSDQAVRQAAAKAFSPDLIRNAVNAFLNGNYDWLSGKKAAPDYVIDLTAAKQSFAKQVGQATQAHLASLPVCSPAQLQQLQIPVDPLTINCRPATLDPQAEGNRVTQEVNSNSDFLANPVVSASSLSQSPNQPVQANASQGSQNGSGQPYYKKLSWLPMVYQVGVKLPWLLGVLALLCVLGIVFIAPRRRRGVRRIGWVLLLAGLILAGLKFLADAAVKKFAVVSFKNALAIQIQQPISDFMRQLEPQLVRHYLPFAVIFVLAAIVIFVTLIVTRRRAGGVAKTKPAPAGPARAAMDDEPAKLSSADDLRLAPRRAEMPGATAAAPKAMQPLGKKPPRRKPPRLIQ